MWPVLIATRCVSYVVRGEMTSVDAETGIQERVRGHTRCNIGDVNGHGAGVLVKVDDELIIMCMAIELRLDRLPVPGMIIHSRT